MTIRRIQGVIPIVLTPMKPNGDIDTKSCATLIHYLVENGASGLYILGSASEGFLLDNEQRSEVVFCMAEANDGRIPLIAGCSHMAPRSVYDFFKRVETANIDGVHFIPEDLKIGDHQLVTLIKNYAEHSPFPFYLYHNIKRGRAITFQVVTKIKNHPNMWGIKVGGYDKEEMKAFLKLEDDEFQIFGSGGGQFLDWLELGAQAVTASAACCFPKLFYKIYHNYKSGEVEAANKYQKVWIDFHSQIPNTAPDNGEYAAEEKYILKKLGVIEFETCHFPYRSLTAHEQQRIDNALIQFENIIMD